MADSFSRASGSDRPATRGGEAGLTIGLVNAMSDAALAITERRFLRLVAPAFPDCPIHLRCVTLPRIARGEMAAARIARHYDSLESFFAMPPDMVIFSGAEPATQDLRQEIFWPDLALLFDWVRAERIPALFSCLAAHAGVLHYAGIARRRLAEKAFGMFEQSPAPGFMPGLPHDLLRGVPDRFAVAHSRWNEVSAADLQACGYGVLTRGPATEVDVFVPRSGLPQIFLQGHPEYEPAALAGEYRRDLRRFALGETSVKPAPPKGVVLPPEFSVADRAGRDEAGPALPATPAPAAPQEAGYFAIKLIQNWFLREKERQG